MAVKTGDRVRGKRLGWDERLTQEQELDLDPYESSGDDLEGELQILDVKTAETGPLTVYLVAGQEADPRTLRRV